MKIPKFTFPIGQSPFAMSKLSGQKIAAVVAGILAVTVGVFFGFRALSSRATGADPQNVTISKINENSAAVSWKSSIESQCTLEYGTAPTSLTFFGPETIATTSHLVKLSLLSPKTTYYFQIHCGESRFSNAGVPWSFQTTEAGSAPLASPSASLAPTQLATPSAKVVPQSGPSSRPAPIQTLRVPSQTPNASCTETDCQAIKAKLGQGCTTQDYFLCVRKATPTP